MLFSLYQNFKLSGFVRSDETGLKAESGAPAALVEFVSVVNTNGAFIRLESFNPEEKKFSFGFKKVGPADPDFDMGVMQQAERSGFFAIAIPDAMRGVLLRLETKNLAEQRKIEILNALAFATDSEKEKVATEINIFPV